MYIIDSVSVQIKEVSIFGVREGGEIHNLFPCLSTESSSHAHTNTYTHSLIPVSVTVSVHGYWLGVLD